MVARDGVGQLSVRNVAQQAGLATASLRRAFPTQDALRAYCLELVRERTQSRIDIVDQSLPVPEFVEACLLQLLPLDDDRRLEMEVFIAIGVLALTDSALRAPYGKVHDEIALACLSLLRMLANEGPHRDVGDGEIDIESRRLHALIDGLALHLVRHRSAEPTDWATEVLSAHLLQLQTRWQTA